jgi:hypothetical protein
VIFRRSFARGSAALRRGLPRITPSGQSFLILTAGGNTAPNYFRALRHRLQLAAANVEIVHFAGTDPLTLARQAIRLRDERKQQAEESFTIAYDEVWVVHDLEKPQDEPQKLASETLNLPEAAGLHFASSAPCFEFWLLLHHEYPSSPLLDREQVIKRLETCCHDYSNASSPSAEFLERIPSALVRAARCRKLQKLSKSEAFLSTSVDILVRQLNTATRSHHQLQLR